VRALKAALYSWFSAGKDMMMIMMVVLFFFLFVVMLGGAHV
jgi:hypothetical protein